MISFDLVVKATLVLLATGGVAHLLRFKAPAWAHWVRILGFVGIVALPFLISFVPVQRVPILPTEVAVVSPAPPAPVGAPRPVSTQVLSEAATPVDPLPLIWMVGASLAFARLGHGLFALRGLRRRSVPFACDPALVPRAGLKGMPELRIGSLLSPMTWGVWPAVVLLPVDAPRWSAERLEAVLLHEFAHIRRRDFATGLLAEVVCALYWFHPLVWMAARETRADAETAADDAVLRTGVAPSTYATVLLGLAAELDSRRRPALLLGVSAMSQPKIETRLESVLAPRHPRLGLTRVQALAAVALVGLAIPALAGLRVVSPQRSREDNTLALIRAKSIARGTLLYANDYDERYPLASSTAKAREIVRPYVKAETDFSSPTPGAGFFYNPRLSAVSMNAIPDIAMTPLWYERLSKPKDRFVVAFTDSHVKLFGQTFRPTLEAGLRKRF